MTTVRVAMIQMLVEGGRPEANLERAAAGVREAARQGAQLAVLPECLDLGWTDPSARESAQPIPGRHSEVLSQAARDSDIYLVAGLVERSEGPTRLWGEVQPPSPAARYNSAVLIGPDGRLLGLHRKINELDIARDLYCLGDRLAVVDTEFGRIGINICADNLPSSLFLGHSQACMGATMLLSPSAWAVDADHDNEKEPYEQFWLEPYRELSRSHGIAVVGVSGVGWITDGPWKGRKVIGCSLAVSTDGAVAAQAPYGSEAECVMSVDLTISGRH